MMTTDETHLNLISLPHHHTISYHNNREASALAHKIINQDLGPCLTALKEREKERQGQNWPGKNLLPNLSMKIKVATFDQWESTCFYNLGSFWNIQELSFFFFCKDPCMLLNRISTKHPCRLILKNIPCQPNHRATGSISGSTALKWRWSVARESQAEKEVEQCLCSH